MRPRTTSTVAGRNESPSARTNRVRAGGERDPVVAGPIGPRSSDVARADEAQRHQLRRPVARRSDAAHRLERADRDVPAQPGDGRWLGRHGKSERSKRGDDHRSAQLDGTSSAEQLVRNAREDHVRLEQQPSLDVQRPLVVQQARPAADDDLRQHDIDDQLGVRGQLADVGEERCADVAIRRLAQIERQVDVGVAPFLCEAPLPPPGRRRTSPRACPRHPASGHS